MHKRSRTWATAIGLTSYIVSELFKAGRVRILLKGVGQTIIKDGMLAHHSLQCPSDFSKQLTNISRTTTKRNLMIGRLSFGNPLKKKIYLH